MSFFLPNPDSCCPLPFRPSGFGGAAREGAHVPLGQAQPAGVAVRRAGLHCQRRRGRGAARLCPGDRHHGEWQRETGDCSTPDGIATVVGVECCTALACILGGAIDAQQLEAASLLFLVATSDPPPPPTPGPSTHPTRAARPPPAQVSILYLPSAQAIQDGASQYAWYFFAIASGALVCYVAQVSPHAHSQPCAPPRRGVTFSIGHVLVRAVIGAGCMRWRWILPAPASCRSKMGSCLHASCDLIAPRLLPLRCGRLPSWDRTWRAACATCCSRASSGRRLGEWRGGGGAAVPAINRDL